MGTTSRNDHESNPAEGGDAGGNEPKGLVGRIGRAFINTIYGMTATLVVVIASFYMLDSVETTPEPQNFSASTHAPAPAVTRALAPEPQPAPAAEPQKSSKLVCPKKQFPSCDAARRVFHQWKNNRYIHGDEAACRHAAAAWFLDDVCGGPG